MNEATLAQYFVLYTYTVHVGPSIAARSKLLDYRLQNLIAGNSIIRIVLLSCCRLPLYPKVSKCHINWCVNFQNGLIRTYIVWSVPSFFSFGVFLCYLLYFWVMVNGYTMIGVKLYGVVGVTHKFRSDSNICTVSHFKTTCCCFWIVEGTGGDFFILLPPNCNNIEFPKRGFMPENPHACNLSARLFWHYL